MSNSIRYNVYLETQRETCFGSGINITNIELILVSMKGDATIIRKFASIGGTA